MVFLQNKPFTQIGTDDIAAKVNAIYLDGKFAKSATAEANPGRFGIILDRTCFYAEQGGQMNDTGSLTVDGVLDFAVEDVQVYAGYVLHVGYLKFGSIELDNEVTCSFDEVDFFQFSFLISCFLSFAVGH